MKADTEASDLEQLRQLLLGDERKRLDESHDRLEALEERQRDLPQRLPGLLQRAAQHDGGQRLGEALAGPVSGALSAAIRDNRRALIDTLFPVVGPTIRKAIAESMRNLVGDINAALVSSFSLRGLRWRLESWRSGVPYSQVVLRHTLRYRIDHVFLIERETGLLIHHAHQPDLTGLDGDAIAGMLTAIGDFVRDSVDRDGEGTLESARVGEYLLELSPGPLATLACFVRGVPPARFHEVIDEIVEELHLEAPMGGRGITLTPDQHAALQPPAIEQRIGAPALASRGGSLLPIVLLLLIGLGALLWHVIRVERWESRIDDVRRALAAHPGFVLVGLESSPWSRLRIHGLLDPDAAPVTDALAGIDLGGVAAQLDVAGHVSTDDVLVQRRAQRLLQAPTGVDMVVERGVLRLRGKADAGWIERARDRAGFVAGVTATDFAVTRSRDELDRQVNQLQRRRILFDEGIEPRTDPQADLDAMAAGLIDVAGLARELGVTVVVRVLGDNDRPGSDSANVKVRERRRDWLAAALEQRGVAAELLDRSSLGTTGQRGARLQLEIKE